MQNHVIFISYSLEVSFKQGSVSTYNKFNFTYMLCNGLMPAGQTNWSNNVLNKRL